jgi:hypothetical protein
MYCSYGVRSVTQTVSDSEVEDLEVLVTLFSSSVNARYVTVR